MRTEPGKNLKPSWPKTVVRKWLNIKSRSDEFNSDCNNNNVTCSVDSRRKSCSDKAEGRFVKSRAISAAGGWLVESSESLKPPRFGIDPPAVPSPPVENLRVFVGTWNVGGRAPHRGLNLRDWLMTEDSAADVYVLGFQEIVPLNAGNVLGSEDKVPADTWHFLIRQALNHGKPGYGFDRNDPVLADRIPAQKPRVSFSDLIPAQKPRVSFSDLLSMEDQMDGLDDDLGVGWDGGYRLAASKQMVGLLLCVWVRSGIFPHVQRVMVSCVGRGIMGYMGNKGSISISMTMWQTSFCFVCAHLTSGERDGDEHRRNSDVIDIMKRTRFSQSHRFSSPLFFSPECIAEHDKVIWLGDLNYRISTSCNDTHELMQQNNWQCLLEKDQLRLEQRAGRVFEGWEEGRIHFPPTYKYLANSDHYAVNPAKSREKHRNPAWCDRILWRGEGIKQTWYARGESRFSDHRPVYSLFTIQLDKSKLEPWHTIINSNSNSNSNSSSGTSSASCGRVEAEEMLLDRTQSLLEACRF